MSKDFLTITFFKKYTGSYVYVVVKKGGGFTLGFWVLGGEEKSPPKPDNQAHGLKNRSFMVGTSDKKREGDHIFFQKMKNVFCNVF